MLSQTENKQNLTKIKTTANKTTTTATKACAATPGKAQVVLITAALLSLSEQY